MPLLTHSLDDRTRATTTTRTRQMKRVEHAIPTSLIQAITQTEAPRDRCTRRKQTQTQGQKHMTERDTTYRPFTAPSLSLTSQHIHTPLCSEKQRHTEEEERVEAAVNMLHAPPLLSHFVPLCQFVDSCWQQIIVDNERQHKHQAQQMKHLRQQERHMRDTLISFLHNSMEYRERDAISIQQQHVQQQEQQQDHQHHCVDWHARYWNSERRREKECGMLKSELCMYQRYHHGMQTMLNLYQLKLKDMKRLADTQTYSSSIYSSHHTLTQDNNSHRQVEEEARHMEMEIEEIRQAFLSQSSSPLSNHLSLSLSAWLESLHQHQQQMMSISHLCQSMLHTTQSIQQLIDTLHTDKHSAYQEQDLMIEAQQQQQKLLYQQTTALQTHLHNTQIKVIKLEEQNTQLLTEIQQMMEEQQQQQHNNRHSHNGITPTPTTTSKRECAVQCDLGVQHNAGAVMHKQQKQQHKYTERMDNTRAATPAAFPSQAVHLFPIPTMNVNMSLPSDLSTEAKEAIQVGQGTHDSQHPAANTNSETHAENSTVMPPVQLLPTSEQSVRGDEESGTQSLSSPQSQLQGRATVQMETFQPRTERGTFNLQVREKDRETREWDGLPFTADPSVAAATIYRRP